MASTAQTRAPAHLWIVGALSLLWNCFGAYDYLMTRTHNTAYLAKSMPGVDPAAVSSYIDSMPLYAQVGWGLGVWLGLLGSVLLLIRNRWAVASFGVSLLGAVVSLGYQLMLATPMPGATGTMSKVMPIVIIAIALALFLYARAADRKAILR